MTTPKRSHPVVVIVTNPQSAQPLSLRMIATNPFRRGEPATIQVIAEGGTGGYVYALGKLALPPGMGPLDPVTGISTGTPTTAGHYEFEIEVQDSSSTVWSERFTVDVVSRLTPGDVTPVKGEIGVPYNYQLTVRGATGAVTWRRIGGTLPAGLTLPNDGPGLISGTPAAPFGRSYLTVRATDAGSGDTLDMALVMDVAEQLDRVFPGPGVPGNVHDVWTGVRASIDLRSKFTGGVPPYTVEQAPPFYVALEDFRVVQQRTSSGSCVFVGAARLGDADLSPKLITLVNFKVTDALGMSKTFGVQINVWNSRNSIGAQLSGTPVQRSLPTINFTGSAVTSVTSDEDATTVQIDTTPVVTALGLSVLGRNDGVDGTPVSIQAAADNRVLARTGGTLQWTQVTPAMLNFTAVQSVTASSPLSATGTTAVAITHGTSGVAAGTYDRVTVDVRGHVTAGALEGTAVFTRSISASLQYNASDFSSMTTSTEVVRLTGTAGGASTFNEFFASPRAGQTVIVVNASTTTITVKHNTAGGTAGSKILCGADFSLPPDHGMTMWRDGTSSAWRVVGIY